MKAVDQALRELALEGHDLPGGGRWVPWRALLAKLSQQHGLPPEVVMDRLGRQPGVEIDLMGDRLVLKAR